jgi:hypothetical protein
MCCLFFDFRVCLHFLNINNDLFTLKKNAKRSSIWVSNERSGDLASGGDRSGGDRSGWDGLGGDGLVRDR